VRKDFLGRGWQFPLAFDPASGGVAMSEFEENIRQCITIILGTKPGERQMLPEFGCTMHELMFAPNTDSTATLVRRRVVLSLKRWEPRIEVESVDAWPDQNGTIRVEVKYTVVSTGDVMDVSVLLQQGG